MPPAVPVDVDGAAPVDVDVDGAGAGFEVEAGTGRGWGDTDSPDNLQPPLSDEELVRRTLRAICADPAAQASARAQAARTLAEMTQLIGRAAKPVTDPGKPVRDLSRAELEAALAAEIDG